MSTKTKNQPEPLTRTDHYLVGIGASAGGLEAIHKLFDHFPSNSSFSFVIVQHLSPDHKSLMAELLSKHTKMQVREAEDNMVTQPNCVYVLPSGKQLTIKHGRLNLVTQVRNREPNFAIDVFFESLAQDLGRYAIGVILSGTGTDGTKGVKKIKAAGGMVMVQDPATAKFDGMPKSAIEAGAADFVFSPERMPNEIIEFTRQIPLVKDLLEAQPKSPEDAILDEILELICTHSQTNFKNYKRGTINRRIQKRIDTVRAEDLPSYLTYLHENPAEIKLLCQEFLIGVTSFFRDQEAFDLLEHEVIPDLISRASEDNSLKVWVTACSTGEEVYSLAMLFQEALEKAGKTINLKLFATDVDQRAIRQASKGAFSHTISQVVSAERLQKFFHFQNNKYTIKEDIRKLIIFAQHDLQKDPPFSKIDLITCRNMLIYLNPDLQNKVLAIFPYALKQKGYLLLGPSENIGEMKNFFSEKNRKWKLYQKIKESKGYQHPYGTNRTSTPNLGQSNITSPKAAKTDAYNEQYLEALSANLMVAGLYIDENFQLLHGVGAFNRFLKLPDKQLQLNLLKMVPSDLAVVLSVDVRKALKSNISLNRQVVVGVDQHSKLLHLVVKPVSVEPDMPKVILVLLQELEKSTVPLGSEEEKGKVSASETEYFKQMTSLENELKDARESLHMTVQDLSTANEELQSTNEELMSSNEELQSSNEEMQSLNEELHTVNSEHQIKIRELQELNEDLDNYIRSSNIAQLFLDHRLVIRKFTPTVKEFINIIDIDLGLRIHHLSHNLKYNRWLEDIQQVNNTSAEIEKEVETQDGKCFLMRILPYLKHDGNKDGVVLSFVDVTALKTLSNVVQGVLNSSLNNIMALKAVRNEEKEIIDFKWMLLNYQAEILLGKKQVELLHQSVQQELPFLKKSGLFKKLVQVVETEAPLHVEQNLEINQKRTWYEIAAAKMGDGLTISMADIDEKKISEEKILLAYEDLKRAEEDLIRLNEQLEKRVDERTQELTASQERFRLVSMATNDVVWDWNLISNDMWWSESLESILGYKPSTMSNGIDAWFSKVHPEDKDRVVKGINNAINHGKDQWIEEFKIARADGTYAFIYNRAYILHNEYQMPHRVLGSFIDLSDLKDTQIKLKETNAHLLRVIEDLDNFVYTASHDLKTPIHNIEALLRELKLELPAKDAAQVDVQQIMTMMEGAIERFKKTISNLTEITKLQNENTPETTTIAVAEIVQDIILDLDPMIKEVDATVEFYNQHCPTISFSEKNLRSIIYNLLSNAIKYHSPARKPHVKIACFPEEEYTVITVQDNGLGMNEDQKEQLFSMFQRFHDHVEGSGIGLYMVRKIVHNAGGEIEVESVLDEGTTFKVYLRQEQDLEEMAL